MIATDLLFPVLALIGWTFVMWVWMYVTRVPAMQAAKIDVDELSRTGAPLVLPAKVSRVADNYNHLHEQPTIFYALVLTATLLGAVDGLQAGLAWAYVGLRIVHSLIQAISNPILIRFLVFLATSAVLFALFVHTVLMAI